MPWSSVGAARYALERTKGHSKYSIKFRAIRYQFLCHTTTISPFTPEVVYHNTRTTRASQLFLRLSRPLFHQQCVSSAQATKHPSARRIGMVATSNANPTTLSPRPVPFPTITVAFRLHAAVRHTCAGRQRSSHARQSPTGGA